MSDTGFTHSTIEEHVDDRIDAWINAVEVAWRGMGVSSRNRRRMSAELQADLEDSMAAGAGFDSLTRYDVSSFARDLAEANDALPAHRATPANLSDVVVPLLSGGILGATISWFVVMPGLESALMRSSDLLGALIIYTICGALTLSLALAAVLWRFHGETDFDRHSLTSVGLGFTIGGIVGLVPACLFGASTGYSGSGIVMLIEVGIVASACAVGVAMAWSRRAVRDFGT